MRILLVDPNRTERLATIRLIPADCHELTLVRDASEALLAIESSEAHFELALIEAILPGTSGPELIKRIRAVESERHLYIVVTASHAVPGDLRAAFAAGADDFIRKSICREELIARIEAPARIRRWATKLLGGRDADAVSAASLISTLAWNAMESTVASDVSDMIGFPLIPLAFQDAIRGANLLAATTLSLPSENIDLRIAVGFDDDGGRFLAQAMFGDDTVERAARADMLREIVNVSAAALKRAASKEGRTFTTGVPLDTTIVELQRGEIKATKQWVAVRGDGGTPTLRFEVQLRVCVPKRIKLSAVREGMVTAVDLRNANGGLLMPSGTRIAASHLRGLMSSLGADTCVDIVEAA